MHIDKGGTKFDIYMVIIMNEHAKICVFSEMRGLNILCFKYITITHKQIQNKMHRLVCRLFLFDKKKLLLRWKLSEVESELVLLDL